jgi:pimeloyl-ACP methyl ester carboxylesterase
MMSVVLGGSFVARLSPTLLAQDQERNEGAWLSKFDTADGRVLEYFDLGPVDGLPLVCHHGTPASALTYASWEDVAAKYGLRLIAYSRPGYGISTRLAGRDVAQAASDTAALLDHLGADRFVTIGWSGGGPHALACGALLAERCKGVATLAGVGAWGQGDLDFLAGMAQENVDEFGAALIGEPAIAAYLAENYADFHRVTGEQVAAAFGGLISAPDKAVLTDTFANGFAESSRWALHSGFGGWIDDDIAFTKPWGFDPGDIRVPATVWQGQQDNMVPAAHGKWLAKHIRGARFRYDPDQGHLSLATTHLDAVLQDLAGDVN